MLHDLKPSRDDWLERKSFGITRNSLMMAVFATIVIGFFSYSLWRYLAH